MGTRAVNATPLVLGIAMFATAVAVEVLQPTPIVTTETLRFAQTVPAQFGDWKEVAAAAEQVDPGRNALDEPDMDRPYDQVLMRAYGNSHGEVVLLALAYGRNQRQEVKIHRPDVCYTAQGFQLLSRSPVAFPVSGVGGQRVGGMRMLVTAPGRTEAVSYWIRIGDIYTEDAWAIRYHIFRQGLSGRAVDGVLVRVSQIVAGTKAASAARYEVQEKFLAELVRALPAPARRLLLGEA